MRVTAIHGSGVQSRLGTQNPLGMIACQLGRLVSSQRRHPQPRSEAGGHDARGEVLQIVRETVVQHVPVPPSNRVAVVQLNHVDREGALFAAKHVQVVQQLVLRNLFEKHVPAAPSCGHRLIVTRAVKHSNRLHVLREGLHASLLQQVQHGPVCGDVCGGGKEDAVPVALHAQALVLEIAGDGAEVSALAQEPSHQRRLVLIPPRQRPKHVAVSGCWAM
mmetsp:Transcript_49550/g.94677  ORF Transcript_49550/g.94677 Transcript_49550/m.94677 type:complete len:219 (+) Transcript_49550:1293-1949(+)